MRLISCFFILFSGLLYIVDSELRHHNYEWTHMEYILNKESVKITKTFLFENILYQQISRYFCHFNLLISYSWCLWYISRCTQTIDYWCAVDVKFFVYALKLKSKIILPNCDAFLFPSRLAAGWWPGLMSFCTVTFTVTAARTTSSCTVVTLRAMRPWSCVSESSHWWWAKMPAIR